MQKKYTGAEHELAKRGYVYLKDLKQARDGTRTAVHNIDKYARADLVFDRPAWAARPDMPQS